MKMNKIFHYIIFIGIFDIDYALYIKKINKQSCRKIKSAIASFKKTTTFATAIAKEAFEILVR